MNFGIRKTINHLHVFLHKGVLLEYKIYYIDKSVLVENRLLVNFIQNYIRDLSGEFSISSLVRILMMSFPTLTLLFVQKYSCPYNKKKITWRLEDMNFIFSG